MSIFSWSLGRVSIFLGSKASSEISPIILLAIHQSDPSLTDPYISTTRYHNSTVADMFHSTLEMDCEAFAREVLKEMQSTSEQDVDDNDFNKRRLDLRPSLFWLE